MRLLSSFIALLILTSCGNGVASSGNENLRHDVAPAELSARMTLKILSEKNGEKKFGIVIENPERIPVQSVRAWLTFDAERAIVQRLAIEDERFSLFAPGEKEIDTKLGLIKIGTAAREPIVDPLFTIASFTVVPRVNDMPPAFTFHDWRAEGDGHTAVLSFGDGTIRNILSIPPSIEPW